ncbi:HNH endonuclease signature motif containing protein [Gordonia crocea]|uniref:DUF222 domain-containing protein n=1 Tax=Gordonia crocea TaxID=589162 RepID=A0A7M3SUQ1_9ACTN|nr:HNH endonuclease signature motif containing protein [Gordonia crocea]GED96375.1 hypothetical protein nbrc107697_04140 [Gordonia crocea]
MTTLAAIAKPGGGFDLPIDLAGAVDAAEREAAMAPLVFADDTDDPGPDHADAHLNNPDSDLWQDRAHALDAAMAVTVGEPAWTIDVLGDAAKAAAMIAWAEYREIGAMHTHLTRTGKPEPSPRGVRLLDIDTQCAARIAMSQGLTQRQGEHWLQDAIAMRDRLPRVGRQLRDGHLSPRQFRLIITRTELIDDHDWAPAIDTAIADILARHTPGSWSTRRLADMVDRIIFRHDPDAVRRRHDKANHDRCTWILPGTDGMSSLGATMTAENAAIAYTAILDLAAHTCPHDTRTSDARNSDALYALITGTPFDCDCHREDCTATIPDPTTLATWIRDHQNTAITNGRILVHVIANHTTLAGHDDEPAYLNGHGIISAAHLRNITHRNDTTIRPLNPTAGTVSLPTHLPSDPYRPSAALDTFIRIRDGYCTTPGCNQPAWTCDIDHTTEFDHHHPHLGGQTTPDNLTTKCRLHHRLKTFGTGWLDDHYRTRTGHLTHETVTPEDIHLPGPAETNTTLFPTLDTITWHQPPPPTKPSNPKHHRPHDRTKTKHARRRAEREANRKQRLANEQAGGDPPF